jgi:competence ComEA-like helix-hairpin-helix protein
LKQVDLNTATSEELQRVPGIGPETAERILQMRKSYGSFKKVDDLLAIRGISKERLEKMRKYLTVGKPPLPDKPTRGAAPPKNSSKATTIPQSTLARLALQRRSLFPSAFEGTLRPSWLPPF